MQDSVRSVTTLLVLVGGLGCPGSSPPRLEPERATGAPAARAEGPSGPQAPPSAASQHGVLSKPAADGGAAPTMEADATPRQGRAQLAPLAGSTTQGTAALNEVPEGVHIALHVERGKPGVARVALQAAGRCPDTSAPREPPEAAASPGETVLGTLPVGKQGEGTLDVTLHDVNLQAGREGTLLGQALTVYRSQLAPRSGERSEVAVACAPIVPAR